MFYSANELAGLPGLPGTVQGVRWTLNRITETHPEWKRKREGTKAFEYHIDCLPAEAQKVLRKRLTHQVLEDTQLPAVVEQKAVKNVAVRDELEVMVKCPELALREVQALTDKQKAIADARILLATEVHKLREYAGMTRKAALKHIVDGVRMGALPDRIIEAANTANARQGKRTGVSTGSLDSWYSSWVMARGDANQLLALLAPGHHKGTPWEQVWWLSDFFMFYRSWKRPTVEYAYREFSAWWHEKHANDAGMLAALPSVHAVRRVLSSVPVIVKERFRSTGSAWRSLNPFVRREWTSLPVNAVWVGDGHCMKMTAFNPLTGNIFRPEVTLVMDAGQRFIVGWSLSLSENVIAVADALRYGMAQHGIPLIYYSDNGGGEKNLVLDADITGILPRLGVEHHTGIPGNPQGRGVIERVNKEIPKDVALSFQTYCARDADKETVMMQQRIMQSAIKASPPEGINSTVTIKSLTGGTDRESDADLLARYLDILRRPPAGGNKYDYKRWALEVDGVTSAYVEPLRRGLGTVDVAITSANDLPSQELINAVLAHIEEVRPVTAKDTMVLAPTKKAVDFVVRVKTSGLTVEQIKPQITEVITDFMNRLEPGQELIISQLETQISLISGVSDRRIIMPSDNVKAVVNESTWEWLRPGSIDIQPFPRES